MDQDEEWATTFGKREQNYIQTLLNNTQKEKKKKNDIKVLWLFKDWCPTSNWTYSLLLRNSSHHKPNCNFEHFSGSTTQYCSSWCAHDWSSHIQSHGCRSIWVKQKSGFPTGKSCSCNREAFLVHNSCKTLSIDYISRP